MNIAFYLIPKSDVAHLMIEDNVGNALRLMRKRGYQAVPVINDQGEYCGTISEGDFLWNLIVDFHMDLDAMRSVKLGSLKMKWDYRPVPIDADITALDDVIINQNFVPIVDDRNVFIGIVTRKEIIKALLARKNNENKDKEKPEGE